MPALSSSSSDCIPPVPSRTRSDVESTSSTMLVASIVAVHAVTSIRRLCPALAAAPVRVVLTESVPFSGPSVCIDMRRAY